MWDVAALVAAITQLRLAGTAPIVRVPVGEFATVSRVLDFGAEGVIAPMINTPADARAFVSFAKFPPVGERSWGPHRATTLANMPDQKIYLREANELTVTFAMIETQTALDNMEAIAATPTWRSCRPSSRRSRSLRSMTASPASSTWPAIWNLWPGRRSSAIACG